MLLRASRPASWPASSSSACRCLPLSAAAGDGQSCPSQTDGPQALMHLQTMPPDAALRRGTCVLVALPQAAALVGSYQHMVERRCHELHDYHQLTAAWLQHRRIVLRDASIPTPGL